MQKGIWFLQETHVISLFTTWLEQNGHGEVRASISSSPRDTVVSSCRVEAADFRTRVSIFRLKRGSMRERYSSRIKRTAYCMACFLYEAFVHWITTEVRMATRSAEMRVKRRRRRRRMTRANASSERATIEKTSCQEEKEHHIRVSARWRCNLRDGKRLMFSPTRSNNCAAIWWSPRFIHTWRRGEDGKKMSLEMKRSIDTRQSSYMQACVAFLCETNA